jgi:4-amino-4-deoxy-L-arabinose transferase-like glycosyltransferase
MRKLPNLPFEVRLLYPVILGILFASINFFYFYKIDRIPFHPDESTYIFMSSDFFTFFQNPKSLYWDPSLESDLRQHYREMDAPLTRMMVGAGFWLTGTFPTTTDWNWSESWEKNKINGALPNSSQLIIARVSVTWLFPFSLILIYLTGKKIKGKGIGILLVLLYASNSLILLHTRRAMEESVLEFSICLAIWGMLNVEKKPWVLMVAAALAFNSKQSAIILVPITLFALCWIPDHRLPFKKQIIRVISFLCIFCGITFLLNPYLWSNPFLAAKSALSARSDFISAQVLTLEQVAPDQIMKSPGDRLLALIAQYYIIPPAAEDVGNYSIELGGSINNYLNLPGTTLFRGIFWGGLWLVLSLMGIISQGIKIVRNGIRKESQSFLILTAFIFQVIFFILFIPIPYQRYWLPIVPFICIWCFYGMSVLFKLFSPFLKTFIQPKQTS